MGKGAHLTFQLGCMQFDDEFVHSQVKGGLLVVPCMTTIPFPRPLYAILTYRICKAEHLQ